MKKYNLVVSGGTFDYFHKGHEEFLLFQLQLSNKIILGITSDAFAQKKNMVLQPYSIRLQAVEHFLDSIQARERISIEKIDTIYIPNKFNTLPIEAIIVTKNTQKGAQEINSNRTAHGLSVLPIVLCPQVLAQDKKPISSTRIRSGEISREGDMYIRSEWLRADLLLPQSLRKTLQEPFGEVHPQLSIDGEDKRVVTVGDVVTQDINKLSKKHFLSIIDFRVERKEMFTQYHQLGFSSNQQAVRVHNPAGHITAALFSAVKETFSVNDANRNIVIHVEGEEDLAVLPVVLAAPLGTFVLYGQPGVGVVTIKVSEETKNKAYSIVSRFKIEGGVLEVIDK